MARFKKCHEKYLLVGFIKSLPLLITKAVLRRHLLRRPGALSVRVKSGLLS